MNKLNKLTKLTKVSKLNINNNIDNNINNNISNLYEKNLKEKGVKKIHHNTAYYYAHEYLYLNIGKPNYIEDIKNYVIEKGIKLNGGDSLQVRHLGQQYGYNILKGGDNYKNNKIKKATICY